MKNRTILLTQLIAVVIFSCGQVQQEETETTRAHPIKDTVMKIRVEDTISDATLATKNSTIKQLSFAQLLQYMPGDLDGYNLEDPINGEDGSIGKSGSRYFSFASKTFSKKNQRVRVEIIDYTADTVQYHGLLNMYGFNTDIDNNIQRTKKINLNIPGTKAIAAEYKMEKTSQVIIGAAGRVLIVITGIQVQDIGLLQKVARKIDFKNLIKEVTAIA